MRTSIIYELLKELAIISLRISQYLIIKWNIIHPKLGFAKYVRSSLRILCCRIEFKVFESRFSKSAEK
jgi:hypothetical protein